jgi:hypothetical protein
VRMCCVKRRVEDRIPYDNVPNNSSYRRNNSEREYRQKAYFLWRSQVEATDNGYWDE